MPVALPISAPLDDPVQSLSGTDVFLRSSTNGDLVVIDAKSGNIRAVWRGIEESVSSGAVAADGRHASVVLSGGRVLLLGTDKATTEPIPIGARGDLRRIVQCDGTALITMTFGDSVAVVWSTDTSTLMCTLVAAGLPKKESELASSEGASHSPMLCPGDRHLTAYYGNAAAFLPDQRGSTVVAGGTEKVVSCGERLVLLPTINHTTLLSNVHNWYAVFVHGGSGLSPGPHVPRRAELKGSPRSPTVPWCYGSLPRC